MVKLLTATLTLAGLLACGAPSAHAATTVGVAAGAGPDAGEALEVNGDRRANDITISLSRGHGKSRGRTRFEVVDRRGRVGVKKSGRRWDCRVTGRHAVVCAGAPTSYAYVSLGAGDDRLTVRTAAGFGTPATTVAVPDGLAGIPVDEGGEGSFLGWRILGGSGRDRISGSPYFDHIIGGPGSDVLDGKRGADRFDEGGESGQDAITGGSGQDTLVWTATTPLHLDLRAGRFDGGTVRSVEKARGGPADDVLVGSDAAELLQGAGGADIIAGLGGADLLVGDGVFLFSAAADTIDGGPGDDLIDVSNKEFQPFAPAIARSSPGPPDSVICGDGNDRVDTSSSQYVEPDCEGARFHDVTATVALRPLLRPDGALVYDIPCPAKKYFDRPVGVCEGTLTLIRSADGKVLGSSGFLLSGGSHGTVAVTPVPAAGSGQVLGVQIMGAFDGAPPSMDMRPTIDEFDFGWAIVL